MRQLLWNLGERGGENPDALSTPAGQARYEPCGGYLRYRNLTAGRGEPVEFVSEVERLKSDNGGKIQAAEFTRGR